MPAALPPTERACWHPGTQETVTPVDAAPYSMCYSRHPRACARFLQEKILEKPLDLFGFGHGFGNDAGSSWVIGHRDEGPGRS